MAQSPHTAKLRERRSGGRPLRVLVVDDDRDTVDGLAFILRDEGDVVQCAYTGKEVLSMVSIFRPDAVILDIVIPHMSGYALAQAIRHSYIDGGRPLLIAVSGMWKETPDRKVAQQAGFDEHLTKPYEPAALLRLLAARRPRES